MEKKQSKKSVYILGLLMLGAFTLALQFGAVGALAQDQDLDGLSDTLENSGFALNGMTLEATGATSVKSCSSTPAPPRDQCVDPTKQDYFVIIQRATKPCPAPTSCGDPCGPVLFPSSSFASSSVAPYGSDIAPYSQYPNIYGTTSGPLQWVPKIATGFATHSLLQNPPSTNQLVTTATGGWYAVKIVEDLNPCSSWMGLSTPGTITPSAPGSATVWPEKIMNWIDKACSQACFTDKNNVKTCYTPATTSGTFTCKNANNTYQVNMKDPNDPNLIKLYHDFIKNIVSHETSHLMHLAFGAGTSADNHWPAAIGTLMEQSIGTKATNSKGNITVILYISNSYASQDPAQHALK
jgi:hypothetical protein